MKKVLITGANKGIGFEVAKQLLQKGYFVFIGSRDKAKGLEASKKLILQGFSSVDVIQIDVTSDESVDRARKELGEK